nr:hypothetical protein [Hyphomonas sp. Mor2]
MTSITLSKNKKEPHNMSLGRRLFIVDPSLKDVRGHHFALTRSITQSAKQNGLNVYWFAAADASADLREHTSLIPLFGQSMYSAYMLGQQKNSSTISSRLNWLKGRLIARTKDASPRRPATEGEAPAAPDLKDSILKALESAFEEFNIGPSDRLLFHTADGATYEALAELVMGRDVSDLPRMHVCTPYDPVGIMPNRASAESVQTAIDKLRAGKLLERRVFLYGENPYLADHLTSIWSCPVRSLDLPVAPISEHDKARAEEFRRNQLHAEDDRFLIASLGAARIEKGFHLIPDIIRRVFEFAQQGEFADVARSKIKFVLHASPQIVGRHPVISNAIEKLQVYSEDQVQLLLEPLSDADYNSLTLASDAVLMPYDQEAYRVRGSGVVSEAIVARKFIIAKSGSYPSEMALWQGGAIGETPQLMAKSLLTIIKNRWQRIDRVKAASIEYMESNSISRYFEKVVDAERDRWDENT